MGIQLKSTKLRSTEDLGESTRLDFQLEFSEIHVWSLLILADLVIWFLFFTVLFLADKFCFCLIIKLLREAGSSILEILKVDLASFVYIPVQVSGLQSITVAFASLWNCTPFGLLHWAKYTQIEEWKNKIVNLHMLTHTRTCIYVCVHACCKANWPLGSLVIFTSRALMMQQSVLCVRLLCKQNTFCYTKICLCISGQM